MIEGDDEEDTALLKKDFRTAINYLNSQTWCERVISSYFGIGVGGIVGVYLFEFSPNRELSDNYVWVITGDLPYLYLHVDECPNPACALDAYIGVMSDWADTAINEVSQTNLPDIGLQPTKELGEKLKNRLNFIDENVLIHHKMDLHTQLKP